MALVLMLPLTLMAVSIMQWSREQMKMSAATSVHFRELANTDAGVQTVWLQPDLLQQLNLLPMNSTISWITENKAYQLAVRYEMACGRTVQASSSNLIRRCRYADVSLQKAGSLAAPTDAVTTLELPLLSLPLPKGS